MSEAPLRTKLFAGLSLVFVSSSVGILYKVSQASTGGFAYSTASAVCMAEAIKLAMSCTFHVMDKSHYKIKQSPISSAIDTAQAQLTIGGIQQILILSFLYTANNQLNFYNFTIGDPGTIFLFKTASTLIVAILQALLVGKQFVQGQWMAMGLQACGMVIAQYDPCKSAGIYPLHLYLCMGLSTLITSISAARNEYMLKTFKIDINVQNVVMYAGGVVMNFIVFLVFHSSSKGFFEGYDFLAILVVAANAVIGLVITAVYKYADAVVKCIASDITAVFLMIVSVLFFNLHSSIIMWCGVAVVIYAVHDYIRAAATAPTPTVAATSMSRNTVPGSKRLGPRTGDEEEEGFASDEGGVLDEIVGAAAGNDSDGDSARNSTSATSIRHVR